VRPESNETRENAGRQLHVASYNLELCSSFLSEPAVMCPNGTTKWELLALFGCADKPTKKHCWLICCERKILFRLKKQAEKDGL
jgi:hypothetical protein